MTSDSPKPRSLVQTLAVQEQIQLPGTVGRLLQQIRNLEQVAPLFVQSRLVRSVERPKPLNVQVAGIGTRASAKRVAGGFLYAALALRVDISVVDNVVATRGEDSLCDIDDIDYEDQAKRFQLIGMRQAYDLADRALNSREPYDMILMDCPLLLNRSMVAPQQSGRYAGYRALYEQTIERIRRFWAEHRDRLFPWNHDGPILAGLSSERYGAIVSVSQQDFRTEEGRAHALGTDELDCAELARLTGAQKTISTIGERRFIRGILGSYTRTAAFRMSVQTPRMEPDDVMKMGVVGFHYAAGPGTPPRLVQLVGDEPEWHRLSLDQLAGRLMALTVVGGQHAFPLPIQLAAKEMMALDGFLEHYRAGVHEEMKRKSIENIWLSEMDDLN